MVTCDALLPVVVVKSAEVVVNCPIAVVESSVVVVASCIITSTKSSTNDMIIDSLAFTVTYKKDQTALQHKH